MKGLAGGPLLVGGLGPSSPMPPQSGPVSLPLFHRVPKGADGHTSIATSKTRESVMHCGAYKNGRHV